MRIDIYQGSKQQAKFIAVEAGQDITDSSVVAITDPDFKSLNLFKSNVLLQEGIVGIDPTQAEKDILSKKYHIWGARINISYELKPLK